MKSCHDNKCLRLREGVKSKNVMWSPLLGVCFETSNSGITWALNGNADSQAPLRLSQNLHFSTIPTWCLCIWKLEALGKHFFTLEENIPWFRLWLWLLAEVWPWPCYKTSLHLSYFGCRKGITSPISWGGCDTSHVVVMVYRLSTAKMVKEENKTKTK